VYEVVVVAVLIYDRQSLFQTSISSAINRLLPQSEVVDRASESEVARWIIGRPGTTLFLGQVSLRSETMRLAKVHSCPVVWIAERKDSLLPLMAESAICGIMYRTARAADLRECFRALREGRTWIQPLDRTDDDESASDELWKLLTLKEKHIAALLIDGVKNKAIAVQLGTTYQVIKNRTTRIYNKLGVDNRIDLFKTLQKSPPTCESASMAPHGSKQ
jgi:DNA-binding NarL/FixJ family response regulator